MSGEDNMSTNGHTGAAGEAGTANTASQEDFAARTSKRSTLIALVIAIVVVLGLMTYALKQSSGSGEPDVAAAEAAQKSAMVDYGDPLGDNDNAPARPKCPVPGGQGSETGSGQAGEPGTNQSADTVSPDSPLRSVKLPCLGAPGQGEIPVAEALVGKPTVMNVWAWNCAPCRNELPVLEKWAAAHPEYNLVGVQASNSAGRGAYLLNELGVNMVSYQDSNDVIGAALSLPRVVPVTVVLRADGTVAKFFAQEFRSEEELDAAVREALA